MPLKMIIYIIYSLLTGPWSVPNMQAYMKMHQWIMCNTVVSFNIEVAFISSSLFFNEAIDQWGRGGNGSVMRRPLMTSSRSGTY